MSIEKMENVKICYFGYFFLTTATPASMFAVMVSQGVKSTTSKVWWWMLARVIGDHFAAYKTI